MRFKSAAGGRWIAASTLLVLSFVAAPVMAQSGGGGGGGGGGQCNNPTARVAQITNTVPETTNGTATRVELDGSDSTPKTSSMTYSWTQLSGGPSVSIMDADKAVAWFSAPDVPSTGATLRFRLRAGCNGNFHSTEMTVNIGDVVSNSPPTAIAVVSPANALEGEAVTLDGSASTDIDPGTTLTYNWSQIGGSPEVVLTNVTPSGSIVRFTAPNVVATTSLTFRLTVSDGALSSSTDRIVNVLWTNDPPVARLACPANGLFEVDEGGAVVFDGSTSSDTDGTIVQYSWDQVTGLPSLGIGAHTTASIAFDAPRLGHQQLGGTTVRLTVTDNDGASSAAECGLFIRDVTAPVIDVPNDIVAEADSADGKAVTYTVLAQDAVDDETAYSLPCAPASGTTFALAPAPARQNTTAVACSAVDSAGNRANAGFNVTVQDTTPPELTVPGSHAVEATSAAGAMAEFEATTADLVDGPGNASCAPASGSVFPLGTTEVACGAVDARGNVAAARSFNLTVHDTTAPVVTPPADVTGEATGPLTQVDYGTASATDAVGVVSINSDAPDAFPVGDTVITWTARDAAGNAGAATSRVTVTDTTPPTVTVPGDINDVEATSPAGAVVAFTATASDLVDGSITPTCTPASGTTFGLGTTRVNCSATDRTNNPGSAAFSVTVVDTTAPRVSAPAEVSAEATGPRTALSLTQATASDAVGVVRVWNDAPADFPLGATTVTWFATDAAGNVGTATSVVSIVDTTAPAWNPQLTASVSAQATDGSRAVVHFNKPTATDLVYGDAEVTCSHQSGDSFPAGETIVSCTARDGHDPANVTPVPMTLSVRVNYGWAGFQRPVDNLPTVNVVKAGSAVPVKFTLAGDQGMAILQQGSPSSGPISCTAAQEDVIAATETLTASNSSLTWDATAGHYVYVWKTEKAWSGCRALSLRFVDGSTRSVMFRFTK